MKVEQIGDWTLEDRLAAGGRPLVVFFMNSDLQASPLLQSEFRRAAGDHPDARFYVIDLLENPSLVAKYSISMFPKVLVFVDGVEVARSAGPMIATTIDRVLGPCHQEGEES